MTIMMNPAAICQTPATMHRGKIVRQHQAPKNIAAEIQKFFQSFLNLSVINLICQSTGVVNELG